MGPVFTWRNFPYLAAYLNESTLIDWVFLFICSTCPNHLSLVWRKTSVILAIPSLFCNSSDDFLFLRLTWHTHHTICMSVRSILLMSFSFSDHVSLPYSMTLLKQVLCNNTRDIRRSKSLVNFFNLRQYKILTLLLRLHVHIACH